jgi:CheY-like chemotaxis protein
MTPQLDVQAVASLAANDKTRIVHYIEDNDSNQRLVGRLLAHRPQLELRTANTAQEGLDAVLHELPDLILLDNRLPDGTGADVLQRLKGTPVTVGIPVVILTGDTAKSTADEVLKLGAAEILIKPYDIFEFLAMIDRHTR